MRGLQHATDLGDVDVALGARGARLARAADAWRVARLALGGRLVCEAVMGS